MTRTQSSCEDSTSQRSGESQGKLAGGLGDTEPQ